MKLSVYEKHRENPFIKQAIEQVDNHLVKKYKTASKTGEKAVLQAIDRDTGEIKGHTQFIRQIEVDEDKFAKVYLSNFSAFHNLGKQAIKVFGYVLEQLVPNRDMFMFFMDDCMKHANYATKKPIYKGLADLVEAEIIARGPSDTTYFINPLVVFNGSRITFAKTYIKKQKSEPKEVVFKDESLIINPNQTNLLDQIEEMEND